MKARGLSSRRKERKLTWWPKIANILTRYLINASHKLNSLAKTAQFIMVIYLNIHHSISHLKI
jgi:hypothetical protein